MSLRLSLTVIRVFIILKVITIRCVEQATVYDFCNLRAGIKDIPFLISREADVSLGK